MTIAFGIDVSLTHGSVVVVELIEKKKLVCDQLFSWDKKDSHSLSLKSSMESINLQVFGIVQAIGSHDSTDWMDTFISIDWSTRSVHWRSKRLFAVQMGIMMGMFYEQFLRLSTNVSFVTPQTLRKYWGLQHNASKEDLQKVVLEEYPPDALFKSWANEDDIDAYILAVHNILTRGSE